MSKVRIAMPQWGNNFIRLYMKSKYIQSLRRAGAKIRWIELDDPEKAAAEALECDGLLLPGGDDLNPSLYGQDRSDKCGKPDDRRDRAEMKILEAFLPTNKPIFCVCRGLQLLNVFFGATLHQDIKGIQVCKHSHFASRAKSIHHAKLFPRTKLAQILQTDLIKVNSLHHQAVDKLGPGLTVAAVSEDGFIEGLEVFLHPFCVAVQWHPEHMGKNDPLQQKLFDHFVQVCKNK